jgi:hypothetical protein
MYTFKWAATAAIAAFIISLLLGIISGVGTLHLFLRAIVFSVIFFALGFALRFVIESYFPDLLVVGEPIDETEDVDFDQGDGDGDSRVNITVDSMGEYAVPELYKTPGDPKELGNIEDLISGNFRTRSSRTEGVDRTKEEEYNDTGGIQNAPARESPDFADLSVFDKTPAETGPVDTVFTPSFGDETGLGGLPDLDALASAFSSSGEPGPAPMPAQPPVSEGEALSFGDDDVFSGGGALTAGAAGGEPDLSMDEFVPQQTGELEQVKTRTTGNKAQPLQGDFKPEQIAQGIRTVLSKDQ